MHRQTQRHAFVPMEQTVTGPLKVKCTNCIMYTPPEPGPIRQSCNEYSSKIVGEKAI